MLTLQSLAREATIPDYETLPKSILFKKIQESFNIERLERAEARRKRICETKKKRNFEEDLLAESESQSSESIQNAKKARIYNKLNKIDPIMFAPIKKRHTWKFVRPNGSAIVFNIESLVDFVLASGDFSDPETRLPFSDKDLAEIDEIVIKAGLTKASVLETKRNPNAFVDSKFRRDALQGLERCAGEVVTDMLTIIENCDPEEAQMRLVMRELPMFADYYRQLGEADMPFAKQCMTHWRRFLMGPPNRPNEDIYGLLDIICHYLDVCEQYQQVRNASAEA
eukprot:CAMPEP_0119051218 /NCGR_PEP_ID=MMETSP1177-20130426/72906_1 /TAXON_ID=2985 /ORGANISM="Ochromonas sp, Strain CCMP1899" /LENGTH=281 /DNA_ID=CAMNT_0007030347 /DNA_START=202 /DNA_END=1047 /DNA_ORIENTATION=+